MKKDIWVQINPFSRCALMIVRRKVLLSIMKEFVCKRWE